MRATIAQLSFGLVLLGTFSSVNAQTNASRFLDGRGLQDAERQLASYQEEQADLMRVFVNSMGQSWMTNYYGKTLSSLGDIIAIHIDRRTRSTPDWTHRYLWQMIEESKVQPCQPAENIRFGVPPIFTIEYSGGLRVQADRYNVLLALPDGRKGSALLDSGPHNQ